MVNLTYRQGREDHSDPCESPRDSCRSDCRRWTGDRKVPLPAPTPKAQALILSSLTANRKCVLCLHHPRPWDRRQPRSKPRLRMEGSCKNPRALSREPPGPLPPPHGLHGSSEMGKLRFHPRNKSRGLFLNSDGGKRSSWQLKISPLPLQKKKKVKYLEDKFKKIRVK